MNCPVARFLRDFPLAACQPPTLKRLSHQTGNQLLIGKEGHKDRT
jgi:hypothetical protein